MAALPRSPAGHRRSSSGGGLRPVVPFGLDSGVVDPEDDEEMELGPVPRENSEPFAEGAGVDEVEYAYGYVRVLSFTLRETDDIPVCNIRFTAIYTMQTAPCDKSIMGDIVVFKRELQRRCEQALLQKYFHH